MKGGRTHLSRHTDPSASVVRGVALVLGAGVERRPWTAIIGEGELLESSPPRTDVAFQFSVCEGSGT